MAASPDVAAKLQRALDVAAQCASGGTSDRYEVLGTQLQALETVARQSVQGTKDCKALVAKLRKGAALSSDELGMLRAIIVGDADYYLKYDEDFDRAKGALDQIIDEIRSLQHGELDAEALAHLGVLCREACSVLTPTEYYLQQKERVRRFEDATRGPIGPEAGKALADVVADMMPR